MLCPRLPSCWAAVSVRRIYCCLHPTETTLLVFSRERRGQRWLGREELTHGRRAKHAVVERERLGQPTLCEKLGVQCDSR